jgi:hypothetical protein
MVTPKAVEQSGAPARVLKVKNVAERIRDAEIEVPSAVSMAW